MLPDFWGSDYDYLAAHGEPDAPVCAECEEAPPARHVVIVDANGEVTRRNLCRDCAMQFYGPDIYGPEEAR